MSAPKGNKFASKPDSEKRTININFRVTPKEKKQYDKLAKKSGVGVTQWIRERLSL